MMLPYADPFTAFDAWYADARAREIDVPSAMCVSSVGADGRPSVRMVLMKEMSPRGLVFYTNLGSRKGLEILARPFVSACFHWKSLERQVIVEGPVEPVTEAEADAYFATRPRGSQVGAWASIQSTELASAEILAERIADAEERFAGRPVPRPAYWSGLRVVPDRVELWQGRPSRLHERTEYRRVGDAWHKRLLYP